MLAHRNAVNLPSWLRWDYITGWAAKSTNPLGGKSEVLFGGPFLDPVNLMKRPSLPRTCDTPPSAVLARPVRLRLAIFLIIVW